MKIVNIIGGLGNQLFQYAFALGLKFEYPDEEIKINTLCFKGYPLHNGFELDKILCDLLPIATVKDLAKYAYPWAHYRLWQVGNHFLPLRKSMTHSRLFDNHFSYDEIKDKSYFDGYWQAPMFFEKHKEEIIASIQFPEITERKNLDVVNFINRGKTAFIHVRRGDYLGHPQFGGICTLEYYQNAIKALDNDFDQYVLFSNDPNWTKDNILPLIGGKYSINVDWNRGKSSFRDIQIMSKCKGGIIANSSFSWWGAWLSGSDDIIAPAQWCRNSNKLSNIVPENWSRIDIV